ncbi:hypothetical protein [Occultella kanbiaonis]|uniref:hypothetical protein n=1 Tax=Occultella kanbiaonis TaxID=2675754 RepID=UPI0012B8FA00|nr:hypothetical protein [Occultella kanbiaonis]
MATLTTAQVYGLARRAGLDAADATIATAIAAGESGLRTDARGDVGLQTSKWGPSIGLWQVRSLNAERGTGGVRDELALTDPEHNARSMVSISAGGSTWRPWTVYTSGAWRQHLAAAEAAADGSESGETDWRKGGGAGTQGLGGSAGSGGSSGGSSGSGGGLLDGLNPFSGWQDDAQALGIKLAVVGAGAVLIIVGAWRAVSTRKASE